MSIIDAIKNRNSHALMSEQDIDPAVIRRLLDAAVCVPVHHRTDPWRFLVIRGAGRAKLGDVMAAHLAKDMDDPDSPKNTKFLDKIRKKPFRAPVIIAVAAAKSDCKQALMVEDVAAVSASCQNILLAAADMGLAAIWRTGGFTYAADTAQALGFDEDTQLVGFIYLGHPAKEIRQKERPSAEKFTRWLDN
ncbi:MAG: nitroreductase [Emcibacter sp.]|nr:nitroreductase [Emcibacter sp.]